MSDVCVYMWRRAREVNEYGDRLHATEVPTSERLIGRIKNVDEECTCRQGRVALLEFTCIDCDLSFKP
jgi:hypothetical protein